MQGCSLKVSFGATVKLLPCDLEVTGLNLGNSLSACRSKAAYIYLSQIPSSGSLLH